MVAQYSLMWLHQNLCKQSCVDWHLGYFQSSTIRYSAAVKHFMLCRYIYRINSQECESKNKCICEFDNIPKLPFMGTRLTCIICEHTCFPTIPSRMCAVKFVDFFCQIMGKNSSSVQFSPSVMTNSLWPHGLQHARPPCPSPTPRVYPNTCPLSRWCHPTISSSVVPFSSCLQSFLALGSFHESALHIRWPKYWSFSFSISPFNENSGLISFGINWFDLAVQGTLKSLLQHHSSKASWTPYCQIQT